MFKTFSLLFTKLYFINVVNQVLSVRHFEHDKSQVTTIPLIVMVIYLTNTCTIQHFFEIKTESFFDAYRFLFKIISYFESPSRIFLGDK